MANNESTPTVTIGIPTYNGAKRIEKSLRSALLQKGFDLEVLISDNHSTDNTEEVCKAWMEKDSRIKYVRQAENLGIVGNFNFLLAHAQGKYFMWLADDDVLEEGSILPLLNYLESHPSYTLASGGIQYWHGDTPHFVEDGLSFEQDKITHRLHSLYKKVEHGAIIYGLQRRVEVQDLRMPQTIANDWHFLGLVAAIGKIKQLDHIFLHKHVGGVSRNNVHYIKSYKLNIIWAVLFYERVILDTYRMVMNDPVFIKQLSWSQRINVCLSAGKSLMQRSLRRFPERSKSFLNTYVLKKSPKLAASSK